MFPVRIQKIPVKTVKWTGIIFGFFAYFIVTILTIVAHFINVTTAGNQRMNMMMSLLEKKPPEEMEKIRSRAAEIITNPDRF